MSYRYELKPFGDPCSLIDCPPGVFEFDGDYGFRSEYGDDAYCLDSGEFFWGGVSGRAKRNTLVVQPMMLEPVIAPTWVEYFLIAALIVAATIGACWGMKA